MSIQRPGVVSVRARQGHTHCFAGSALRYHAYLSCSLVEARRLTPLALSELRYRFEPCKIAPDVPVNAFPRVFR